MPDIQMSTRRYELLPDGKIIGQWLTRGTLRRILRKSLEHDKNLAV